MIITLGWSASCILMSQSTVGLCTTTIADAADFLSPFPSLARLWNCGRPQAIIVHRRNVQNMEMAHQWHKDSRTVTNTSRAFERCQFISVTGPILMIRRQCPASRRTPFIHQSGGLRAGAEAMKSRRASASSKHKSTLINKRKSELDRHSSAFSSCGRFCWILNQRGFGLTEEILMRTWLTHPDLV